MGKWTMTTVGCGYCGKPIRRWETNRVKPNKYCDRRCRKLGRLKEETLKAERKKKEGGCFYKSEPWRVIRYDALVRAGGACFACGRTTQRDRIVLHVDHIKPISRFPELKLDPENLQVLCEDCNLGKGAWDETDWR